MKKGIFISIIIIVAVLIGIVIYNYQQAESTSAVNNEKTETNSASGPHIVVEPLTHDFGRVKYGEVAVYNFTVKNTGDQTLEIKSVSTSCGCTKGEIAETTILPGGQADLKVSFDPAVHEDDTDLGQLSRTIYIDSNDPDWSEIEAKIYADVYKE